MLLLFFKIYIVRRVKGKRGRGKENWDSYQEYFLLLIYFCALSSLPKGLNDYCCNHSSAEHSLLGETCMWMQVLCTRKQDKAQLCLLNPALGTTWRILASFGCHSDPATFQRAGFCPSSLQSPFDAL